MVYGSISRTGVKNRRAWRLSGEFRNQGIRFYLILNAYWEPLEFELPAAPGGTWRRWIDTSLDSPDDIVPWEEAPPVAGNKYPAADSIRGYALHGWKGVIIARVRSAIN